MNDKARKLKNDYLRKWRKEHKLIVKEYNKSYWEKKVKKLEEEKSI